MKIDWKSKKTRSVIALGGVGLAILAYFLYTGDFVQKQKLFLHFKYSQFTNQDDIDRFNFVLKNVYPVGSPETLLIADLETRGFKRTSILTTDRANPKPGTYPCKDLRRYIYIGKASGPPEAGYALDYELVYWCADKDGSIAWIKADVPSVGNTIILIEEKGSFT
jgi:hypothetical protein